ncbi:helix-turn-helix domain-containing protein [Clostridium estertheticum]|uniref:helix-turn-helix domain-containing protein n=1 Tax=Clostridium estertheticum TaxID=238834 RepID=UPI001C7DAB7F|nr:XRE family transcriptional regulator [Clostridium estertheticum]MBX4264301.1 XRE family transcriptional regulator [Clostridium estertheticum]WLC89148.1 XRE family transcriptional regulator [Clostridium estertheticum]
MSIGNKVRNYRQQINMNISKLAEDTGLSCGFISQVENDKVSLSLESLKKISSALKIPIKNFVEDQLFKPELVRKDFRPKIKLAQGPEVEVLSAAFGRQLQVLMVNLPSGYQAGNSTHTHDGEEFITVLLGKVKITQGDFSSTLEVGDSIHLDSTYPHLCQNVDDTPAKVIIALTPPTLLPICKIDE